MVSIHAPVKDATVQYFLDYNCFVVSIHAPVKDATHVVDEDIAMKLAVSIHAPVKDATEKGPTVT